MEPVLAGKEIKSFALACRRSAAFAASPSKACRAVPASAALATDPLLTGTHIGGSLSFVLRRLFRSLVGPRPRPARVVWSCVVDDTPEIWSSITPWIVTATTLGNIRPADIFVHHVCPLREEVAELCHRLEIHTRRIEPFDARSPHCNKINQLATVFGDVDRVVLTDVDVAFASALPIHRLEAAVCGKPVDFPNPPLEVLGDVYRLAEIPPPPQTTSVGCHKGVPLQFESLLGNFNGGLYVIDARLAAPLHERWSHWANWLLHHGDLLREWRVHVDQVAFSLAVADMRLDVWPLDNAWNYPTHLEAFPTDTEPYLLHHHARFDDHHLLKGVTTTAARGAVARVNQTLQRFYREHFDNRTFWNHRYAHHAALGSGVGSRGEMLELKRRLLDRLVPEGPPPSILDWGCGDLEVVRLFPWPDYCGVDVSPEALKIAATKRPDWHFLTPDRFLTDDARQRDLVLCLDVLIHQGSRQAYLDLIDRLVAWATKACLIAGFDQHPSMASSTTYFHEPLKDTLRNHGAVALIVPVANYRETQVYLALKDQRYGTPDWQAFVAAHHAFPMLVARLVLSGWHPPAAGGIPAIRETATPFGRFASLTGDLITQQLVEFGAHTRNELAMIRSLLRRGDCVIDIGAHIGTVAIPLALTVGEAGRVLAFEASPLNAAFLVHNAHENDQHRVIQVITAAVWDEERTFGLGQENANNTGTAYLVERPPEGPARLSVRSIILDDWLDRNRITTPVALVKIDAEGSEIHALKACQRLIARDRPLLYVEINPQALARHRNSAKEIEEFLLPLGYHFFRNAGRRNSSTDDFRLARVTTFEKLASVPLWDVLAVHPDDPRYPGGG